ncbi:MAG: ArdC-like ssDNA-binding domain-containing protein [Terracidiphilus sp.]
MSNDKAQELTKTINDSIATLCAQTDAAKQSATYKAWLNTASRFHSYSFGNQILIWCQSPDATRVAGFHTWKSLNRFVKKGEHGIRILAPIIRKMEEEREGKIEEVRRPVSFRVVSVFDVAQTEGEPLAELECNPTEGGETLLPLLEKAITGLNITLEYKKLSGPDGLSKGGAIEIEEALDTPARCAALAHELTHEVLDHAARRKETTKQQRELEAESVAYAVLTHFGMNPQSQFYLANYNITAEMLTASLQTINTTAKRIIGLLSEAEDSEQEGQGSAGDSGEPAQALAA